MEMMDQVSHRGEEVLVVGAGLAGAALAWLCARAGMRTLLVSVNRPASQATAMSAGVVRGAGPPGPATSWGLASPGDLALAAQRVERGCELLREALLMSHAPVGLERRSHVVVLAEDTDPAWLARVERTLIDSGYPTALARTADGRPALVRERDAVVHPRRLAFELMRLARAHGARVQLGTALRRIVAADGDGVLVDLDDGPCRVNRLFWAGGRPLPGDAARPPARTQIVLHQLFDAGPVPLGMIYEGAEGDLLMVPAPLRPGLVVLVRVAQEHPAGGLSWPDPPPAWDPHRGRALRQRLAEVHSGPPDVLPAGRSPVVSLSGLSGWPVSAVLGLCQEVVDGV
jgi:glycine/D-amino acid oxidase-like deaminating enzyme